MPTSKRPPATAATKKRSTNAKAPGESRRAKTPTSAKTAKTAKSTGRKKAAGPAPDPILKARFEAEMARYRKARDEELAGWDERYEALDAIIGNGLYVAAGYKTARAFLGAEAPDQDERTIKSYCRVARHFDPADEKKYGVSRLEALLDYLEATGGLSDDVKVHPDRQQVRVPGGKGKTAELRRVAFADTTVADLRAATRAARGAAGKTGQKASPLEKAIRALLTKAGLPRVGLRVRKDVVDFTGVAMDDLQRLGAALAKAKLMLD